MSGRKRRVPRADPMIDEIRAVREALCGAFGNDIDRLIDHLRGFERRPPERVRDGVPAPVRGTPRT